MQKSLADLAPEDIEEITRLAGLFLTPREVAKALELDETEFAQVCDAPPIAAKYSDGYRAFWSGRLQAEVELRESISKMAAAGSVPAQQMMLDFHKQSRIKMIDR